MRLATINLLALVLALLVANPAAAADEAPWPAEVAPGVYLLRGATGEPDAANRARTGNAGFIVGPQGVLVVDTGTSAREGQALLAAVARVSDRPVRLAVITHARQEFLFGARAFQERGIPVVVQREVAATMASRCEGCLQALRRLVGDDEMRGTAVPLPDRVFDASQSIDAIGRPVRLLVFGHSSGPGDTAVLDVQTGTLFAGGLVDVGRIPDLQDADPTGWRRALAELHALRLTTVVPGHGPPEGRRAIYTVERYLVQLERRVRELLAANAPLSAVPAAAPLPEFEGWVGYDTIHRRNASLLFLRGEREAFGR
ncbi:MAG TPA: MBL fold metallo-hydrolase [Ideonella sp.]|nr:MBL fold metallo-hydrolase [Ideonella sp.]